MKPPAFVYFCFHHLVDLSAGVLFY